MITFGKRETAAEVHATLTPPDIHGRGSEPRTDTAHPTFDITKMNRINAQRYPIIHPLNGERRLRPCAGPGGTRRTTFLPIPDRRPKRVWPSATRTPTPPQHGLRPLGPAASALWAVRERAASLGSTRAPGGSPIGLTVGRSPVCSALEVRDATQTRCQPTADGYPDVNAHYL